MVNDKIYEIANSYVGLREVAGAAHNEAILKMFADTGNAWVKDDETPWCAAFVGSVLGQAGLRGTGKLNARSYCAWGESVPIEEAKKGDIVVLWRKDINSPYGHVGFVSEMRANTVRILGGNQGNEVNVSEYAKDRILAVRRAPQARSNPVQTRTVQASGVQVATAASGAVAAVAALDGTAQLVSLGFAAVVGLLAIWIMRDRIRKFAAGET